MNKNQKYNLTFSIEENEELNAAIDELIRARVQNIIRQECDRLFGRSAENEVERLIKEKMRKISDEPAEDMLERIVRARVSDWDVKRYIVDAVAKYVKDNEYALRSLMETRFDKYIREKFDGILQTDVIGTIVSALLSKDKK